MKIHRLLEDYYKLATCAPEKCKQKDRRCNEFLKCGTGGFCGKPCELCLFWTGCGMPNRKIKQCIKILKDKN